MTWAGQRSEHFCSFQSPGMFFLLTLPFIERANRRSPIKRNVKREISPSARCRSIFCLGIQPNCLNVHSYSESGLPQARGFASSPSVKRRSNCSSLWFHFAVVTAPIVFLKHNKPNRCPRDEWQHMVLSETRGLWLCSIVREGIGWVRRLACVKHGPDFGGCYFPSKSRVSRADGHRQEMVPGDRTDSQPEALKLLVVSNNGRRNVPPSSTRSR